MGVPISAKGKDHLMMERTVIKSRRAMARLKDMMRTEIWMPPSVKLAVLDILVRSIMLYATGIWAANIMEEGKGNNKYIRRLKTLYNMGIRQATGVGKQTPTWLLYVIAKRVSIDTTIKKLVWRYAKYLENI